AGVFLGCQKFSSFRSPKTLLTDRTCMIGTGSRSCLDTEGYALAEAAGSSIRSPRLLWQAAQWFVRSIYSRGGSIRAQISVLKLQRGRNAQPAGRSIRGGGSPSNPWSGLYGP